VSKKLHECIRRTDNALNDQKRGDVLIVEPELYIFSSCIGLIKEIESYVWDDYVGRTADTKDPKPSPKDKNDHFIEDLHRLLIEDYSFVYYVDEEEWARQESGGTFDRHSIC